MTPKPTSSSPATFTGRSENPMKARTSARAPMMPVTMFGLASSKARNRTPITNRMKARFGSPRTRRKSWNGLIPTTSVETPPRASVIDAPPATPTVFPFAAASTSASVAAIPSAAPAATASAAE